MTRLPHLLRELAAWLGGSPHSRLRQLEQLRALDERMLRDVGLTRSQARQARLKGGKNRPAGPPAAAGADRALGAGAGAPPPAAPFPGT